MKSRGATEESELTGDISTIARRHQTLVDRLVADGTIRSAAVEAAFRAVPRHRFLLESSLNEVYRDEAITTKRINGVPTRSSSQPSAMATMLEQLGVQPGQRVLEIGAGTGFNAALLAHLVGTTGQVVTMDLDDDLVTSARANLAGAGFGPERVLVVCGDGGNGYPDRAPFDRIVLTVGAWDIAPAWRQQLATGGRLLVPLWLRGAQQTVAFEGAGDHLTSVSISDCAFVRLRGEYAGPEALLPLTSDGAVMLAVEDRSAVDPKTVSALLFRDEPSSVQDTGVDAVLRELWGGLALWVALREPGFCSLMVTWADPVPPPPGLFRVGDASAWTIGLYDPSRLSLALAMDGGEGPRGPSEQPSYRLVVEGYGATNGVADQLVDQVAAWDAEGRPSAADLRIQAVAVGADVAADTGAIILSKRWTTLVISYTERSR